jgi:hypothetical protein
MEVKRRSHFLNIFHLLMIRALIVPSAISSLTLTMLRHIALLLLKQDKSIKVGIK